MMERKIMNYSNFLNENKELDFIFTGAVWYNQDEGDMELEIRGDKVYGSTNKWDFEEDSKEIALKQLKEWGFRYIGAE